MLNNLVLCSPCSPFEFSKQMNFYSNANNAYECDDQAGTKDGSKTTDNSSRRSSETPLLNPQFTYV